MIALNHFYLGNQIFFSNSIPINEIINGVFLETPRFSVSFLIQYLVQVHGLVRLSELQMTPLKNEIASTTMHFILLLYIFFC